MNNRWFALALLATGVAVSPLAPAPFADAQAPDDELGLLTYVARRGDNLSSLAARYMVDARSVIEVQRINRISQPRRIPIGSRIAIPRRLLRSVPVELRIAGFSGPVTIGAAGGGITPQRGLVIGEGVELGTGANGFVTLTAADGSRLSLPSNSRVRVRQARRYLINSAATLDFEIVQGRADVSAAKQKPDDQFRLRTPMSVTAVRGTEFRVNYDPAHTAAYTEVLEGRVGVAAGSEAIEVAQGFGAAARSGGLLREALLPAPQAIDPGKVQTEEAVAFALKPVATATGYRVQVARDAGFLDVVAEQQASGPRAELAGIGNGRLFMRATATAPSGIEGQGDTWSFRRQRVGLKAEAGTAGLPDGFRFNWLAEGEGQSLYRFQLTREGEPGQPLVDEAGMTDTGITLTKLPRGTYQWRVGVIQTTPDGSAEVWSAPQKFTVSN